MIMKIIILLFSLTIFGSSAFAFDFTFTPFDKALKSGKVVFVGTVKDTEICSKQPGIIKAHANIVIEECMVGELCKKRSVMGIKYYAQASSGTLLPVKFSVGEQVVIALKHKASEMPYEFDSDVIEGTDFAFECNAFPYSILDGNSKFNCLDLITKKKHHNLSISRIKEILINKESMVQSESNETVN